MNSRAVAASRKLSGKQTKASFLIESDSTDATASIFPPRACSVMRTSATSETDSKRIGTNGTVTHATAKTANTAGPYKAEMYSGGRTAAAIPASAASQKGSAEPS